MAVSTALFLLPNQLSTGGISGISTILYYSCNYPVGLTMLLINVPLFVIAMVKVNKRLFFKSILGTVLLSVFIDLLENLSPITNDRFLACIYGGIIMGIGTAIILKAGASTGGTDLLSYVIRAYNNKFKSSNQPKSDLDCKLGIHSANNQDTHKKHQFYWGYKSLIICDAKSGLPIYEETCTADKSDVSSFIGFMKRANKSFSLVNSIVIADKGFDSKKNYNYIKNDLNGTAIIAKNKRNTKNSKSLAEGNLICQAGLAMHKDGKQYLKDSIKQKYRCPFAQSKDDSLCPCGHPRYFNNAIKRGCIKYKNIGTDYRSSVDETSMYFKNLYSKRTECERHNARLKNLNLEYVSVRNFDSVQNLYTLGHICLLSVAIAAKKQNLDSLMKSLVKFKRAL